MPTRGELHDGVGVHGGLSCFIAMLLQLVMSCSGVSKFMLAIVYAGHPSHPLVGPVCKNQSPEWCLNT